MAKTNEKQMSSKDHSYSGQMSDHQLNSNNFRTPKYVKVDHGTFTEYQNFLYNRALFGLSVYSEEELKNMRWDKRKRIIKVHKRAQKVLNIWKQEITNHLSTRLFTSIFPNTPITESLIESTKDVDPEYVNRMSFKTLRITKAQVASKLVTQGVLPPDFHSLKTQIVCK